VVIGLLLFVCTGRALVPAAAISGLLPVAKKRSTGASVDLESGSVVRGRMGGEMGDWSPQLRLAARAGATALCEVTPAEGTADWSADTSADRSADRSAGRSAVEERSGEEASRFVLGSSKVAEKASLSMLEFSKVAEKASLSRLEFSKVAEQASLSMLEFSKVAKRASLSMLEFSKVAEERSGEEACGFVLASPKNWLLRKSAAALAPKFNHQSQKVVEGANLSMLASWEVEERSGGGTEGRTGATASKGATPAGVRTGMGSEETGGATASKGATPAGVGTGTETEGTEGATASKGATPAGVGTGMETVGTEGAKGATPAGVGTGMETEGNGREWEGPRTG